MAYGTPASLTPTWRCSGGLLHGGLGQDLPELVLVGEQGAACLQDVQLQLLAP